jgi:hypothetical protein
MHSKKHVNYLKLELTKFYSIADITFKGLEGVYNWSGYTMPLQLSIYDINSECTEDEFIKRSYHSVFETEGILYCLPCDPENNKPAMMIFIDEEGEKESYVY